MFSDQILMTRREVLSFKQWGAIRTYSSCTGRANIYKMNYYDLVANGFMEVFQKVLIKKILSDKVSEKEDPKSLHSML